MPTARTVTLTIPLYSYIPRKTIEDVRWTLNLNEYKKAHHLKLDDAKKAYYDDIVLASSESDWDGEPFKKARLHFRYWHPTKGRVDKSNPLCIIEKFACDALTDIGFWVDDHSGILPLSTYEYMGSDKDNPRCELTIEEIL